MATQTITDTTTVAELREMAKADNYKSVPISFDDNSSTNEITTLEV